MYLKSLEVVGFKSFADKTKLEFEPGMTAIVGPNGCGKSNVADALRWVLGEQSAKALRGSKMEDCIFNGTDSRKAMGMAEVSVTFSDCEKTLNTEFNEVTIARRVFKSGEGAYFINKTPCRLKDIRRLFMDTGIGTNSYSMLEQGRIDHVLSSRPEDRRAIFEEASGIMKYKADKNEAIRKLDHTEANLLRLSDVIGEVKRQIGSLQRQAGKARRYKTLRDELKEKDLFVTKNRLAEAIALVSSIESKMESLGKQQNNTSTEVQAIEKSVTELRHKLAGTQREIGTVMESGVQASSKLNHTREMIDVNRQRIAEYAALAQRDEGEIDETRSQLELQKNYVEQRKAEIQQKQNDHSEARAALDIAQKSLSEYLRHVDSLRATIQGLREQSVQLEGRASRLQNELVEIESHDRQSIIQKERLSTEKAQFSRVVANFESRRAEKLDTIGQLEGQLSEALNAQNAAREEHSRAQEERATLAAECALLQESVAAENARIEVLKQGESARQGLPEGARLLLDSNNPLGLERSTVEGALGGLVEGHPGYEKALESALGRWIDAVLINDDANARDIVKAIAGKDAGTVHLVSNRGSAKKNPSPPSGTRMLIDKIRVEERYAPVFKNLLGHVAVVDGVEDIPLDIAPGLAYVTKNGIFATDSGELIYHSASDNADTLLAVRHRVAEIDRRLVDTQGNLAKVRNKLADVDKKISGCTALLAETTAEVDQSKQSVALKKGELEIVAREAEEAARRLETVTWELDELSKQGEVGVAKREAMSLQIREVQEERNGVSERLHEMTQQLKDEENKNTDLQSSLTEKRIHFSEISQTLQHLQHQLDSSTARISDLESAIAGRTSGVNSYKKTITDLEKQIEESSGHIAEMEDAVVHNKAQAGRLQEQLAQQERDVEDHEKRLSARRAMLEDIRATRSDKEVELTRKRMEQQNLCDRVTSEYKITMEDVLSSEDPEWDGQAPALESIETTVEELRMKLEAIGPVNLVAIEEYQELEERFAFLTEQEQDLINSKQQLLDMIKTINKTTSEMFKTTFDQVNTNFQEVYTKLFNGGTARLVLVDDEDVLECGIEIIARPPGKRLQNVSLLSGGERTMTAVALLFAIYMIKPSPFCMLDELDAALDESNIGRFVAVLKSFVNQSQFVIITHNRKTIAAADVLYGVTMPIKGISNIVSMKFRDFEASKSMAGAVAAGA